jgi:hypothetical protein
MTPAYSAPSIASVVSRGSESPPSRYCKPAVAGRCRHCRYAIVQTNGVYVGKRISGEPPTRSTASV